MKKNICNKSILILGGTKGIGLECAKNLCEKNSVTCVGRTAKTNEEKINFVNSDFETALENKSELEKLKALCRETDILIITYGPFIQKPISETSDDEIKFLASSNFVFPAIMVNACLPAMKEKNWGRIILFGGTRTDSVRAYKSNAIYAACKTSLSVLTKSLAAEVACDGITINAILPGFTRNAPENTKLIEEKTLAEKIIFLLENEELNGTLLTCDRGWNP